MHGEDLGNHLDVLSTSCLLIDVVQRYSFLKRVEKPRAPET
jgi:hypothetical protein